MADNPTPAIRRFREIILAAAIAASVILSFQGFLDRFAYEKVNETTAESIGLYVLTRAVNAGVSVLKSSAVGVKIGISANVEVGQVLDPVDDAIERLSSALVWAIGSLFIQRIILEVTSGALFQWTFLAAAALVALTYIPLGFRRSALLFSRILGVSEETIGRWQYLSIKIFVLAAIVRFIVPVFLAASFFVSHLLLQSSLDSNREQLLELQERSSADASPQLPSEDRLARSRQEAEARLADIQRERSSIEEQRDAVAHKIDSLNEKAGVRRFVPDMLGGTSPGAEIESLRSRRDDLDRRIDEADGRIDAMGEEIACIDRQIGGESCASWMERMTSLGKTGLDRISAAVEAANNALVAVATTLMAVVAKNILFPLLFLAIVVKCSFAIGRRALSMGRGVRQDADLLAAEARRIGESSEQT